MSRGTGGDDLKTIYWYYELAQKHPRFYPDLDILLISGVDIEDPFFKQMSDLTPNQGDFKQ